MSLFGSDPGDLFMASAMRQMRHMNSMMNSMLMDPFGMMGGGGGGALMPFGGGALMPFGGGGADPFERLMGAHHRGGPMSSMAHPGGSSSFSSSSSSSTVFMSMSGPDGRPQVYSSTSSTKVGPNGVKETKRTVEDTRTGTKKMAIGHHINDRAHVIEREQNLRSGDLEERQEFINLDEDEAEDFDREFQMRARGSGGGSHHSRGRLLPAPPRQSPMRALPAPPTSSRRSHTHSVSSRRPIRPSGSNLALPAPPSSSGSGVRRTYGSVQPQRSRKGNSKNQQHGGHYTEY